MDQNNLPERPYIDEPPPFLGSWRNVYVAVLCYLAALMSALYLFSKLFEVPR